MEGVSVQADKDVTAIIAPNSTATALLKLHLYLLNLGSMLDLGNQLQLACRHEFQML
jgi:hypothetical protein